VEIVYGWIKLHLLFWLGMSPDRLAEMYAVQAPPPSAAVVADSPRRRFDADSSTRAHRPHRYV
jgi:hypothetical protein